MKLTKEQIEIIKSVKYYDNIKILAFAGSGKTSTLMQIAKEYPDKKILYLAFNRKVAKEIASKAPFNVKVYTTHSLAYTYLKRFRYKKIYLTQKYTIKERRAVK